MLLIQDFIFKNKNYKEILSQKPYCIDIKEKGNLVLFKYNQIDSDFSNPLVRECRGLILEKDTWKGVAIPFFKFGNYNEGYADTIDWNSAKILQKCDGSLIKLFYYNNKWNIATNGTIDAYDAELMTFENIYPYKNFGELAEKAFSQYITLDQWDSIFDKNYTYLFELCSPYNRVVTPWNEIKLFFIGCRNNITLQENFIKEHILSNIFPTPEIYEMKTLEDCIRVAQELPFDEEGYVVVDKDFHRIKIKGPKYLVIHKLKGEATPTPKRIIELVRCNEDGEFLNYYPEYTSIFEALRLKYLSLLNTMEKNLLDFQSKTFETRKDMALYIMKNYICTDFYFQFADKKCTSLKEYILNMKVENLVSLLEKSKE